MTGRGGLSFVELVLWTAALEPATQHSGVPAEIRCRYIFRSVTLVLKSMPHDEMSIKIPPKSKRNECLG